MKKMFLLAVSLILSGLPAKACPEGYVSNNVQNFDPDAPKCIRIVIITQPTAGYRVGDVLIAHPEYIGTSISHVQNVYNGGVLLGTEVYFAGFQFNLPPGEQQINTTTTPATTTTNTVGKPSGSTSVPLNEDVRLACYSDSRHTLKLPDATCEKFPTILESVSPDLIVRRINKDLVISQIVAMYQKCGLNVDLSAIEGYWYARMLDSYGNDFLTARHWTNYYISRYSTKPDACIIY